MSCMNSYAGYIFTYNRQCGELVPEKQKIHCEEDSLSTKEDRAILQWT